MKKLFLVLSLVLSLNSYADLGKPEHQDDRATKDAPELKDRFKNLKFEDFKVELYQGKIVEKVELIGEDKENWKLVDAINWALQELKENPKNIDFAGKYKVLSFGCGTMCVHYRLLDIETGQVLGFPSGEAYFIDKNGKITNEPNDDETSDVVGGNLVYKPDSRLLLTDGLQSKIGTGSFAFEFKDGDDDFQLLEHSPVIKWEIQKEEK